MYGVTVNRPDNLLIALVIDKLNNQHVSTIVGHYKEFLPQVDLTNKKDKERAFDNFGNYDYIYLHNLIRDKTKFKMFVEGCRDRRLLINFLDIFNDLEFVLDYYTLKDPFNKPMYPVADSIFRDAVSTRQCVRQRTREFNLLSVSTPGYSAPVELGAFLKSIVRVNA
ncbi:hypothetical protein PCCS19_21360 [Paenibacillus sp. CCS19]|uniref:hypothetical protein n=1 Tax=Paenibacillus sp. CCS19 TaxID=3158387 RepID=UPI00255D8E25|nr:hypothetical protein [Paenibacillus cellulosilyticus]GMK39082.1 hypothetical protein PCCS19_21360 [Paenibacillus cellulosilyticus]